MNRPLNPPSNESVAHVPGLLKEASAHLRETASQLVDETRLKEAALHEVRAMKLARRMEQRGLEANLSFEEKCASLLNSSTEKLAQLEAAVEITAGGFSLGTMSETPEAKTASVDDLDLFVTSGQALIG